MPDDGLITRDRLIDLLRAGRTKRLALIHAPAGFGKTTLARQWQSVLRTEGVPVAWLSLGRDDNQRSWFLSHLIDAVRRVEPNLGADLGALLEQHSGDAHRHVLADLLNQIDDHHRPLAIVLDDWHLINDHDTAEALEFLLDVAPDNLHLIVTSRTRTPAIGKRKVRDQVTEIGATQLRFDQPESAAFLLELNALDLSHHDVHRLWSSTEGWVAALQLATLSLRTAEEPSALIGAFCGRHHSIADYLAENVLDALPADLLDFLLTTSICERLCGGLAAAVSGQPAGQAILEELEHRDMFLRPLDDNREWFRYHHLFAEYLRQRLERDHASQIVALHLTASAWFADQGLLSEAVTHALAAGDDSGAVDLVEGQAMSLVEHSRMAALLGLVNKLPKNLLAARPALQIAIAWANVLLQRTQAAQLALDNVRAVLVSATDETSTAILGEANAVQACIEGYGDHIDRAANLVAPFLAKNSTHRPWLVAVSANIRTFVDIHTFAYDTAQSRQQWANAFHETTSGPFTGVYGRCFAGLAAFAQLNLVTAEQLYTEALASARSRAGQRSHAARLAGAFVGKLHYERGEIDAAAELLEECHELGAESGVADFMVATYCTLARIKVIRGDVDGALLLLDEGSTAAQRLSLPRLSAAVDYEWVRLHLALCDVGRAHDALARRSSRIATGPGGIAMATRHYQLGVQARILCAHNNYDAARNMLSSMRDESRTAGWLYAETATALELARVFALSGDTDAAAEMLAPALVVGSRSGLVRTVIDAGPELMKIISELREAERSRRWPSHLPAVPAEYLSRLLAIAHADVPTAAIPVMDGVGGRTAIPEAPLNAREVEILRLLDRGLSNKQIARNLSVSINTVKWYLKNIYTKLGVTRRGGSVSEARRRKILA